MNNTGFNVMEMPVNGYAMMPYPHLVVINLAEVMRANTEAMLAAFEMGREKARDDLLYGATGSPQIPPSYEAAIIGVYDSEAYGVYTDVGRYQSSLRYWKQPITTQTFASYDEALCFARDGVANALGIAASEVTPMEYPENWRQKVYRR